MPRKPKRAMNVVAQQVAIKFYGMLPECKTAIADCLNWLNYVNRRAEI